MKEKFKKNSRTGTGDRLHDDPKRIAAGGGNFSADGLQRERSQRETEGLKRQQWPRV